MSKRINKEIDASILKFLATNPGKNQFAVICALSDQFGATSVRIALARLETTGKIKTVPQRRELSFFVAVESS